MKPFEFKEIFKSPKFVMNIVGIWPESSPSILYNLNTLTAFLGTFLLTILVFLKSIEDFRYSKMENACFGMCLALAAGHAAFKVCFLQIYKPKFLKIIDALNDPSLTSHEDDCDVLYQEKLLLSHRIRSFLLSSCLFASVMICLSDAYLDYGVTPRTLLFQADIDNLPQFSMIWTFMIISNFYTAYVIGAYEGLIFTLISVANVQLEILNKQIVSSFKNVPSRMKNSEELAKTDRAVNALLRECVFRHNAIERYIEAVEDKFSNGFLVQLLVTLMVTCLIGFCVIFAPRKSVDFYKCIFFFLADMTQVAIVCVPCNEIILQSAYIRDTCYMSNWNHCGSSVAKTLIIMMERSKRPLGFTAGKFTVISLQTFLTLLNTSMSYFTVLKSMYLDSN